MNLTAMSFCLYVAREANVTRIMWFVLRERVITQCWVFINHGASVSVCLCVCVCILYVSECVSLCVRVSVSVFNKAASDIEQNSPSTK